MKLNPINKTMFMIKSIVSYKGSLILKDRFFGSVIFEG